jgi:hypothetical protein
MLFREEFTRFGEKPWITYGEQTMI